MPGEFEKYCIENFGRMPGTLLEIMLFGRWFMQDQEAKRLAAAELDQINTVDDLLNRSA